MKFYRKRALTFVACGILSLVSAVNAGEIYNNLPPVTDIGSWDPIALDGPSYNSFSTDSTASYLTDIRLLLTGTLGTPSQFTVSLFSDSSNAPGSLLSTLGTFNDVDQLSTTSSVVDVSGSSYALAANTRYWVELSSTVPSSPSVVAWNFASSTAGVGVSTEYWGYTSGGVVHVSANTDTSSPYQMSVMTSSSVPEPGTFCQVLTALGLGMIAIARRQMTRS